MSLTPSGEVVLPVSRRLSRRSVLLGLGALAALGGGIGGGLALWNYQHEPIAVFIYRDYPSFIRAVAWSPNGQRIACGGDLGSERYSAPTTHVWDALTGKHFLSHTDFPASPGSVFGLAWSPDGTRLASVNTFNTSVWDTRSGRALSVHNEPDVSPRAGAWSPDSTRLSSGGEGIPLEPTAQSWEAVSGKTLIDYRDLTPGSYRGAVYSVAWSPDGRWIAAGGFSFVSGKPDPVSTLQVWEAATGTLIFTYHETPPKDRQIVIQTVAWSPNSMEVAMGDTNHLVQIWKVSSKQRLLTYHGHTFGVRAVAWSSNGKWIASGSDDGTVQVWESHTGNTHFTYRGHSGRVTSLAWAPDNVHVASGGEDKTVQVWTVP